MRKIRGNLLGLVILFAVLAAMPFAIGEYRLNALVLIVSGRMNGGSYSLTTNIY